jgi:hypothetical protein
MAKAKKEDATPEKTYIRHALENLPEGQEGVDFYVATTRGVSKDKMTVHTYEISWPIPKNDAEAIERYGVASLQDIVLAGIKEISHGPKYESLSRGDDGALEDPSGPQTLADAHAPGIKKVSETKQVKDLLQVASGKGVSLEDLKEMIAKMG